MGAMVIVTRTIGMNSDNVKIRGMATYLDETGTWTDDLTRAARMPRGIARHVAASFNRDPHPARSFVRIASVTGEVLDAHAPGVIVGNATDAQRDHFDYTT